MERLQAKRTVSRAELLRLSEEVSALSTTEDLDPHLEDRIAEIRDELEALAKEIKQQDALIEPHVRDNAIAEEYGGVRKHQALITRTRTRLERLQRKNTTVGGTDNATACFISKLNLLRLRLRSLGLYIRKKTAHPGVASMLGYSPHNWSSIYRIMQTSRKEISQELRLMERLLPGIMTNLFGLRVDQLTSVRQVASSIPEQGRSEFLSAAVRSICYHPPPKTRKFPIRNAVEELRQKRLKLLESDKTGVFVVLDEGNYEEK
ncbi:hypothetical protein HPB47_024953, partial [Ixodes persulcatus]